MAVAFPYSRYTCPCSEHLGTPHAASSRPSSRDAEAEADADADDEQDETFNPHGARACYALYPLDQLLFCDECSAIRCPRCWAEETMCWYCPNCMFEVPSSGVKADGNRCARQCYECPTCQANLSITSAAARRQSNAHLKPSDASSSAGEAYFLHCQYCDWSSLELGVSFTKPTKITEQLSRHWKAKIVGPGGGDDDLYHVRDQGERHRGERKQEHISLHHDTAFANLSRFYKEQLTESSDQSNMYSNSPHSSPANLARIMSLYGGLSYNALKKSREKPQPMREAGNQAEGLGTFSRDCGAEDDMLAKLRKMGLQGTATEEQRLESPYNHDTRLAEDLWPVATKLRVRKGKRCRACRQYLVRPDSKPDKLRYKIRLLASQHLPKLSTRPLYPSAPTQHPSFRTRPGTPVEVALQPYQTQQYVLTVRNPIFERIKVTLATPTTTPGKVASKVTILCPTFTVGPAGDVWEETLSTSTTSDGSRQAAMASLTGSTDTDRQPEAGKTWDKTRNSTSVILEIVPGGVGRRPSIVPDAQKGESEEPAEDEDILEVPIYVRAEWEADASELHSDKAKPRERVSKELAYWCVLGLGRISPG